MRLFDQAKATLDPQTREALQPRITALSRDAAANALADQALMPGADRAALLDDPAVTPEVRLLAESKIAMRETVASAARQSQIDMLDSKLGRDTPQALAKATYVPGTYAAIADGYAAAGDPDKTASARQLATSETLLTSFAAATPANQIPMLSTLEPGPVRDQALRIKAASDRMLADDPLLWGTTAQRASVGELVPLDPQSLDRREQQARHVEALSGQPTLALTRKEIAELKTTLDTVPLAGKQTMLRNLANGLTGDAIARLAPALAGQGPLADGYAVALSTYAAKTPGQNALANRILDGLDRMKAAGEGGRPVAGTGPDWRRAFDEKIVGALPYLGEENAAALLTATAALYAQSMALKGKTRATFDGDELDQAIVALTGAPAMRGESTPQNALGGSVRRNAHVEVDAQSHEGVARPRANQPANVVSDTVGAQEQAGTDASGTQADIVKVAGDSYGGTDINSLAKRLRMDRNALGDAIHTLKDRHGLSGRDNIVVRIPSGDAFFRGQYIGNVRDE